MVWFQEHQLIKKDESVSQSESKNLLLSYWNRLTGTQKTEVTVLLSWCTVQLLFCTLLKTPWTYYPPGLHGMASCLHPWPVSDPTCTAVPLDFHACWMQEFFLWPLMSSFGVTFLQAVGFCEIATALWSDRLSRSLYFHPPFHYW